MGELDWNYIAYTFFESFIFWYAVFITSSYLILATFAAIETRNYFIKNSFTNYLPLISSKDAPSISIIAPAYNEGMSIEENIRSLLSLNYVNYQVIIVNDGSKDDSMEKIIDTYQLIKIVYPVNEKIETKPIRGIYQSEKPEFSKLLVVDKENGGKADALNVGLNVSSAEYVACIDVDCILEQDSLLKMMKPFLEPYKGVTIATGGVIRIANNCIIKDGKLVETNIPKKMLARVQVLEYIRAFILGRMAWTKLNGLLLISGAFGVFDRKIAVDAGGYNHNTVGEDMELVVRMRRYMKDQKTKYRVSYIPDPLCWTEAPETYNILGKQRNRWTRGTIETLWMHRGIFLNPKHKLLGLISYPFWLIFEWMAPLIEFFGILFSIYLGITGQVNWIYFISLLFLVYMFAVMFSLLAILTEELTYNQYKKNKQVLNLMFTAMLEPLFFHPFIVWSAIRGNIDVIRGKSNWGEMTRTGFDKSIDE